MPRSSIPIWIALLIVNTVCTAAETPAMADSATGKDKIEAAHIGRLFYSADERAMLDQMRNNKGGKSTSPTEQFTLNGIVRRSSGKSTTWINQLPQRENEAPQGIAVRQSDSSRSAAQLMLPSGKQVNLKAGQTFNATKGKVLENYDTPADSTSLNSGK